MSNEIFETYGHDPLALFQDWLAEAQESEINDPGAFCLATADSTGRPSARMVLLKELSPQGIKFHTNGQSRKAEDIAANPYGALCIHWKSLRKQIRAEGRLEQISEAEADAYFKTRPRGRQTGAWASQQSRPFDEKAVLDNAVAHYEDKFKDTDDIPRPPYWTGFRLVPERIEFWIGNRDRVHTRFEYVLDKDAAWTAHWVYP